MNDAYERSVKVLSVLIVPAVLAVACFAFSATRPPEAGSVGVILPEPEPAPVEREPRTEIGEAVLTVPAKPASPASAHKAAKKPRTCGWYPMYASGEQRVWICS